MEMVITLALICLLGIASADTITPQCAAPSTTSSPSLTIHFTPSQPTQIAPISTIYGAIMTSYLNVVDCNFVMVENIDKNPAQTGHFTTRTTVPFMTVYRVGCMPETTAITRRDYPGVDGAQAIHPQTIEAELSSGASLYAKRDALDTNVFDRLTDIAEKLSSGIDPMNDNITLKDFNFLRQINTALFALNVVNSGLALNRVCTDMQEAKTALSLDDNLINADQAANIICFAAQYGLYFDMSNSELLSDLAALEYAIQMKDYASRTPEELCKSLDYAAASFLGIDTRGIQNFICNGTAGISHTQTVPFVPSTTGNSSVSHSTWSQWSPTGATTSQTVSIILGTDSTVPNSATSAAGTVPLWWNITAAVTTESTSTVSDEGDTKARITAAPALPFYNSPRVRRAEIRHHNGRAK